jgi:hypothetical protein
MMRDVTTRISILAELTDWTGTADDLLTNGNTSNNSGAGSLGKKKPISKRNENGLPFVKEEQITN